MRKIVVQMMLSLDGCFEGPDHDISWHQVDEELHAHFNEQLATMSAFLEGRVSYELMEAFWPTADQDPENPPTMRDFAGIWRAVPKIVYSRTLHDPTDLELVENRRFGNGVVLLGYAVRRPSMY
jgi:dihydrofolate reductase